MVQYKIKKNIEYFTIKKIKLIFFLCMCKMVNITKETLENNDIEVIVDSVNALWLNEWHIEEQLEHKNLPAVTNKYDKIYKKQI